MGRTISSQCYVCHRPLIVAEDEGENPLCDRCLGVLEMSLCRSANVKTVLDEWARDPEAAAARLKELLARKREDR